MKTWVKYLILALASLFANALVGLIIGWVTGTWPPAGTTWPYIVVGYGAAALWYFLFIRPQETAIFAQLKLAYEEATEAAVAEALEGMVPDRKMTLAAETGNKIVEVLANGLANVYGNEVNDTYREKAREIYPDMVNNVYDIVLGEMDAERSIIEEGSGFIARLEEERVEILKTYGDRVRNDLPNLAKSEWDGLERVTRMIEQEKDRIRNIGRRRE